MKRAYPSPRELDLPEPPPLPPAPPGDLAIVVPLASTALSADERIGLASLRRFAPSDVPRLLVCPERVELGPAWSDFTVLRVPDAWMASVQSYNAMLLSAWWWRRLAQLRQVLIFQTDCLLLRPDLLAWKDEPASFVGPPFFKRDGRVKGVGNGGFSLRRPQDALAVLESDNLNLGRGHPQLWRRTYRDLLWRAWRKSREDDPTRPLGARFARGFDRAEDEFWAYYAPMFSPAYRPAGAETAIRFGAESQPERLVAMNSGEAPLGAHAWALHGRAFWLEQLRRAGLDPETAAASGP